jgi:hypothetical protein
MNTEAVIIKQLNSLRVRGVGADATLVILGIQEGSGHSVIASPSDGWCLEDLPGGQMQVLVIAEAASVATRENLLAAVRFAINGLIYDISDHAQVQSPSDGAYVREWKFPVAPTGEEYA